jgi:putative ABC transport system permease protein
MWAGSSRPRWRCWAWAWRALRRCCWRQQRPQAGPDRRGWLCRRGGGLFAGLSWVAVKLLRKQRERVHRAALAGAGHAADLGAPGLCRGAGQQPGRGLLALVLLVLLRTDLISSWRKATPPDAPNRFVINVMPDQADAFQQALQDAGVHPLRLVPHDPRPPGGRERPPVGPRLHRRPRQAPGDREFNLSNAAEQPPHNQVVAGRWTPRRSRAPSAWKKALPNPGPEAGRQPAF